MYVGDKSRINVSSSQFADFIEKGNLYVDKTMFVEHVLEDASDVLLFTRPRRMGKSLNMNTLAAFLDCKQDTAHLFKGLYAEASPVFSQVNKYPVIYLSFKDLKPDDYKWRFKVTLEKIARKYLKEEQISLELINYFSDKNNNTTGALLDLTINLHTAYGVKPYILIDEYDKFLMDHIDSPEFTNLKKWVTDIFGAALKDNPSLGKAVLTGVTRIAKENMFSGLNNLQVYDILKSNIYDADFSLTEKELIELIPENEIDGVRKWYNNMRVGKESLYNIYSVMSYLRSPEDGLTGYWSLTGNASLLSDLMNHSRTESIARMLEDGSYRYETTLDSQLNMEHLKNISDCTDNSFYTLAVQAGYLSFEKLDANFYNVFIPNEEAKRLWARLFLDKQYKEPASKIIGIFRNIADTEQFSERLTEFASMTLSYHDIIKDNVEILYHLFFFGLLYSLGYECKSNREAGLGRADILLRTGRYNAILEFKVADSEKNEALEKKVTDALKQIDEKEYWHELKDSPLPTYKIGIACCGKKCLAKTVLHDIQK